MIGLDTNALIRLVVEDDPEQTERVRTSVQAAVAAGQRCRINRIALVESVWVLESVFRWGRDQVAEYLDRIINGEGLVIEDELEAQRALDAYRSGPIDFSDAFLALTNRTAGCTTTVTFDRKAARLADFQLISA
ncbi:type II toxin-antitoxin system VapC family toxin [Azospirillum sp. TSO22-1]|uniref:PIN domain-containing protein n=1 Tax=Azospirillum sp. TSO22-1 TaxID=716789 RepID=UPI000D61E791|nr:type II toxin-antitoxin system VapC family toxin [Azospirillum sp. TSO22-1]PWC43581.1 hypothetical protein TSO221_19725 [Azospirillum sp. TSO22-1]